MKRFLERNSKGEEPKNADTGNHIPLRSLEGKRLDVKGKNYLGKARGRRKVRGVTTSKRNRRSARANTEQRGGQKNKRTHVFVCVKPIKRNLQIRGKV